MPRLRKCAVFGCGKTTGDGVILHSFPANYTYRWIEAVNRGPEWKPNTNSFLCSDHFSWVIILKANLFCN